MYSAKFIFTEIGDQVSMSALPENIWRETGRKMIVTDPETLWVFRYNPYTVTMTSAEAATYPEMTILPDSRQMFYYRGERILHNPVAGSQTEFVMVNLGLGIPTLRHPRLYLHEDKAREPDKVVVHTTGSNRLERGEEVSYRAALGEDHVRVMSDEVIAAIKHNYRDYRIVQIGGASDKPLGEPAVDLRGQLDIFATAGEIASAARFIGVNSGPMHIAHCYPHVDCRIVLMEFPPETLRAHAPGDVRNFLFSWLDPADRFYSKYENDIGIYASYRKI
jgi:hypothetical protein